MSGNNQIIDMTGFRHPEGRLTALSYKRKSKDGAVWLCRCDCGAEVDVYGGSLRSGKTKSCGCLRLERLEARAKPYEAFGESKTLRQWSEDLRCRVSRQALRERVCYGMDIEEAIVKPIHEKYRRSPKRKVPLRELLRMSA